MCNRLGWRIQKIDISVNALWPRPLIATAAVQNHLGGDESIRRSRKSYILADCARLIFETKGGEVSGNFFIDEQLLKDNNVTCFENTKMIQTQKKKN